MHKSWRASRRAAGQNESSPFGVRWSKHAQDRQRQRGVCGEAVIAALAFGEEFADHNHCTTYWLTRRSLVEVPRHALRALWRFIGLAVVVSIDGVVVTVQYVNKRKHNWRGNR